MSYLGRTLATADANGGRLSHAVDAVSKDRGVPVPAALIAAVIHLGAVTGRRATAELVGCTAWSLSPRYPQRTGYRVGVAGPEAGIREDHRPGTLTKFDSACGGRRQAPPAVSSRGAPAGDVRLRGHQYAKANGRWASAGAT